MGLPRQPAPRRQTRQRRLVYEAVASTDAHPSAEWVYERVRREMPRVSLGTVYRNLQLLVGEGRLKAWSRGRTTRYDADITPHDHFVCRSCGLLLDIDRAPEEIASERRLRARGHQIDNRILEFIGVCRNCRRGHNSKPSERRRSGGGVMTGSRGIIREEEDQYA